MSWQPKWRANCHHNNPENRIAIKPKVIFEAAESASKLLLRLAVGLGVLVVCFYCVFQAHFFPTGLSLGDTLLFIFVAVGFGVLSVALLVYGFVVCVLLFWPFFEKLGKCSSSYEKCLLFFMGLFLGGLFFVLLAAGAGFLVALSPFLAGAVLVSAVFLVDVDELGIEDNLRHNRKRLRLVLFVSAPVILIASGANLVTSSINILGLGSERASLIVNEQNLKSIRVVADQLKTPVIGCNVEGTDQTIVHNFKVWWHGVGEQSLVEILKTDKSGNSSRGARIELDRKGLKVVRWEKGASPSVEACLTLQSDTLFDSYSDEPNELGKKRLKRIQEDIQKYLEEGNLKVVGVEILGFTDPLPVGVHGDNNLKLSQRRAQVVQREFNALLKDIPEDQRDVYGLGYSQPRATCAKTLSKQEMVQCLAPDRRVELRFKLESVPPQPKSETTSPTKK